MLEITNKITIHVHEIKKHIWFTHQIENGNQWKSLYSPYLLKTQPNTTKFILYGSVIKTTSPIYGIQHQNL